MTMTTLTTTISVGASLTFSYSRFTAVSTTQTFSYKRLVAVSRTLRSTYIKPRSIPCGYSKSYRGSHHHRGFVALHMLECHQNELIRAPVMSHNQISEWHSLEQRADYVAELMERRKIAAGWLAIQNK